MNQVSSLRAHLYVAKEVTSSSEVQAQLFNGRFALEADLQLVSHLSESCPSSRRPGTDSILTQFFKIDCTARLNRSYRVTTLFTIGYEGASLNAFIDTLVEAGVQHVLDVRELPQSRKPGFSKRALSEALREADIGYSHRKQLGDPKHGREAARRGDLDEFRTIFEAHLDLPASREALEEAATTVSHAPTVLLCYERNPKDCHRNLVAKRLSGLRSLQIQHLGVRSHVDKRAGAAAAAAVGHP